QPPVWGIFEPPVALAQILSCFQEDGYEVSVFDLNIELYSRKKEEYNTVWAIEQSSFWGNGDNVNKFFEDNSGIIEGQINKIIDTNPDLIGFSVNVCSLPATMILAERIKRKIPRVKIVIGGPMFFMPGDISGILEHDCIDVIVYGEGEETFRELPKFFIEEKDLNLCRGIYFKKDAKVVKTEARPPIKNLDALPFLGLKSFPLAKYDPPGHLGKHISLMTSRGCVLNCVYCGPKAYWQGFRFMSGQRIYDEVKYHIQNDPDIEHIEFLDLELNGNIKVLSDFCDLMIANPPKQGIRWHANIIIRPEMTKELLLKMKQAGCSRLSIGIETGSQRVLGLMNKRYKVEDADVVLRNAHHAGIVVTTNFMFGFPGETEDDFNLTLDFLKRNAGTIGTVYPSRTFCTIEPFSYLSEHLSEFGMAVDPVYNLYWESEDGKNNYPERLRRCEEFSKLAMKLGVSVGLGLQTSLDLDRYYNLGFYYEYKKDFEKSKSFFEGYLKLDPKNTIINKKIQEFSAEESKTSSLENTSGEPKNSDNLQISFNWDITSICNYRCPYCWFYGKWVQMSGRNKNISASELEAFWSRMYDRYGSIKIFITGGEPFLYPSFVDLISAITRWHRVEVVTNLSWAVKPVIERIQSLNIKIHPSFHPLFADFSDFVDKLILLKKQGLANNPSFVAWPPQISHIDYYAKKFKDY
ncbi:MAG: radical SAM protein, partial [Candidatus Omnitrophota bacterium]